MPDAASGGCWRVIEVLTQLVSVHGARSRRVWVFSSGIERQTSDDGSGPHARSVANGLKTFRGLLDAEQRSRMGPRQCSPDLEWLDTERRDPQRLVAVQRVARR